METGVFSRSWFSSVVDYLMLAWTILCFIGTWFVILKYRILLEGIFAVGMAFLFAFTLWAIVMAVLILLSLFITPSEEPLPSIMFKDLIRRGIRQSSR